jgi:Ca2+-binding RTX toxin-like protein
MVNIICGGGSVDIRQISFGDMLAGAGYERSKTHLIVNHYADYFEDFKGHGFKYHPFIDPKLGFIDIPVAGTVTGYFDSFLDVRMTGLHVDMTDFVAAAKTTSLHDDRQLIAQILDGADTYHGNPEDSYMATFGGDDILIGGGGKDILFGGTGADTFVFKRVHDSTTKAFDVLVDFSAKDHDKIDLSALNANLKAKGDAPLDFIGTHALDHHAGELHIFYSKEATFVGADIDGDGKDDFGIALIGHVHLTQHTLEL